MKRKRKRNGKTIFLGLLTVMTAALLLAGCGGGSPFGGRGPGGPGARETEEAETVFAVNVTPAVEGEIYDYFELNGDVKASAEVDAFPTTSGEVIRILAGVGRYVEKDQVIAEIDPSRPGQTFVASPVKAPISGTVTAVPVQIGSKAAPTTPIARIAKTGDLEIVVYVSEKYISRIATGMTSLVTFTAFPGEEFRARISEVSPVVDPTTRTLETKMRLLNRDSRIKAGMYGDVKIITEGKRGIVKIPAGCVVERFGVPYVFVVTGDSVEQREIERGIEIDNKLEVRSGVSAGEMVVYQGQTLLEDGATVRVIDTVTPLEADDPIL